MIMLTAILFLSFIGLYYGAGWLVKGASALANKFNLSKAVVGITLVAFGTSSPEFFVNIIAGFRGHTEFALTNIAGSNLTNICIGFGLCAILGKLVINRDEFSIDLIFFLSAPLLILFFIFVFPGGSVPYLSFIPFFILLICYLFTIKHRLFSEEKREVDTSSLLPNIIIFLSGVILLYIGGEVVLYSSINIAKKLGIHESIIGLTIVAIGTSIPDVFASVIAIQKNERSIAVGNLIGSNIFNIFLVLGGTLLVSSEGLLTPTPIKIDYIMVFFLTTIIVFSTYFNFGKRRLFGLLLLIVFFSYMYFRVVGITPA